MSEIDRMMEMEEMVSAKPNPTPCTHASRSSLSLSPSLTTLTLSYIHKLSLAHKGVRPSSSGEISGNECGFSRS